VEDSIEEIARIFAGTQDEKLIRGFLRQLLTGAELQEIGSRWKLVRMLHEGASQREIAKRLGLSLCKITRGSRELKKKDAPFRKILSAKEKTDG
jgi:TrpR family trp operon transcriptional repressor